VKPAKLPRGKKQFIKQHDDTIEKENARKALEKFGVIAITEKWFTGFGYRVDLCDKRLKIIVEVWGSIHDTERVRKKDMIRAATFRAHGYTFIPIHLETMKHYNLSFEQYLAPIIIDLKAKGIIELL